MQYKRARDDGPEFKVPSKPLGAQRRRIEETPSHGGGLSDKARERLEEHRRKRAQKKGSLFFACMLCVPLILAIN